jgi:hypothetical protein
MPDQAALAFADTLRTLEPAISAQLDAVEARTAAALDADLLRQLVRAFRDLPRLAPEYDFFAIRAGASETDGAGKTGGAPQSGPVEAGAAVAEGAAVVPVVDVSAEPEDHEPPSLLPAGTLSHVQIVPAAARIERLGQRPLRAIARDANGVRIRRPLRITWHSESLLVTLAPIDEAVTTVSAGAEVGRALVHVEAGDETGSAIGEAVLDVVDHLASTRSPRAGIPEPAFVDEPTSAWRSRMRDGIWEVNGGHPDFQTAGTSARRKLRYLAALLAKEIVLHSFPMPQLGLALERLVGVLTITERELDPSGSGRGPRKVGRS